MSSNFSIIKKKVQWKVASVINRFLIKLIILAANYGNHHIPEHLQSGGGASELGNNENDLRVSNTAPTDSYMTPAHYSGYDDPSEYHNLPTEHGNPHTYNLDNPSEFYGAGGIQLEPKYQPPPFKNYPRGKLNIN